MSTYLSQLFSSNTTVLAANSANWVSCYTNVNDNSASTWNYQGTDVKNLTANWQNTFTDFSTQSANNIDVYTTVQTNSSINWNYQGTDIKSISANWQNTYTNFNNQSANNASVFTTVNSNSATWGTGGGGSTSPTDANLIIGLSVFM